VKIRLFHIKLLFSLLFLAALFRFVRLDTMGEMLRGMNPVYFALSMALSAVMVAASCWKWWLLLDPCDRHVRFGGLVRLYLIGYYFSNLLPSNVGGDVARSYYLGLRIRSQGRAAVTVFLERFTGVLFLLALTVLAPLVRPELYRHPAVAVTAAGAVVLLVVFGFMLFMQRPVQRMERLGALMIRLVPFARFRAPLGRLLSNVAAKAESFHAKLGTSLQVLLRDRWRLSAVVFAALLFYALTWINVYVSFRTFGVEPDWGTVIAMTPPAMFITMLPLAPLGSLGWMEASFTGFFTLAGLPAAGGALMGFLLRFKMLVNGFFGYLFWVRLKGDKDNVQTMIKEGA